MNIIKTRSNFDIFEKWHPKDWEDKHDKEEKERNVDQGWERHDQGEEKCTNATSSFDQSKNSTNFSHTYILLGS